MALFQKSILAKYLTPIKGTLHETYKAYSHYFLNEKIQENILQSKEEQFQEGFLRELFVKFLGYTINPEPNYNLTTEYKNSTDSRKADGAILLEGNPIGIIELKDHKTQDLRDVETQAFSYKSKHKGVRYVIISNFEKLRFYIDDAVDCEEFDLFNLTEADFEKLYLLLSFEKLKKNIPLEIKNNSRSEEKNITDALYKDYSTFKRELFADICKRNSDKADKLTLFRKTQKLLDRLLFMFFAEDRGLIPPNIITKVVEDVKKIREYDIEFSLYDRFKKYFGYLDKGYKNNEIEIFAYNGGLFRTDALLDSLEIDDALLEKHSLLLSAYNFESDVSVDILGHIFEHSLSEIEEIEQSVLNPDGQESTKKSKRKTDGVFYTPSYITHYIVKNTLGSLCKQKKDELNITENETGRSSSKKRRIENLDEYRKWLLSLKVCDPACGSGAFLNAALEFLIEEHHFIDTQKALLHEKKDKIQMALSDIDTEILENNIYGVDINEESVEIAKLSLWLHTARPGRKLTDLSKNIKCGNSLIDDSSVAGEKAFNWEKEFPDVFKNAGFDIIVGNPPYLRVQGLRENYEKESQFYEKHFTSATERFDYYVLFMEQAYSLLNKTGLMSFIIPHKFINAKFGIGIRKFIYDNKALKYLVHFGAEQVFDDANVYTCIIGLSKLANTEFIFAKIKPNELSTTFKKEVLQEGRLASSKAWTISYETDAIILDKISKMPLQIKDVFKGIFQGIVTGDNDAFYLYNCEKIGDSIEGFSKATNSRVQIEEDVCKAIFTGKTISKYILKNKREFLIYPYHLENGKTVFYKENELKQNYPKCYAYFKSIEERLVNRGTESMSYPIWYALWNPRNIQNLGAKKIFTPDVCLGSSMCFDNDGKWHNDTSYCLILKEPNDDIYKAYLAILNSKITWFFLSKTGTEINDGYFRFKTKYLEPFPIPDLTKKNSNQVFKNEFFSSLVDQIHSLSTELQKNRSKFINRLTENFYGIKIKTSFEKFDCIDFKTFVAELKKQKIKLSLKDQDEWEEYFNSHKKDCNDFAARIAELEHKIDNEVYALYGLTPEEIETIEKSI